MIEAEVASVDEIGGGFGESGGVSRRGDVLLDDLNWFAGEGESEHRFDEIPASGSATARAKDAAGAEDEGFVVVGAGEIFAGEFGYAVRPDGAGEVGFDVGPTEGAVEDVVGGEVDELGVDLPAGDGEIAGAKSVGLVGNGGFSFGDVDHVVGGGVEDDGGIDFGELGFEGGEVGDIDRGAVEGGYGIAAKGEDAN